MEDVRRIAIELIYPDGYVERIPIRKHIYHIEYLKEHLAKSQRFAMLCRGENFEDHNHYDIDNNLTRNGVVVMFNLDVMPIVKIPGYLEEGRIPNFMVMLPSEFSSVGQTIEYERFVDNYPTQCLRFAQYDNSNNILVDYTFEEINKNNNLRG